MDEQRSAPARPLWNLIQVETAKRGWSWTRLERETGIGRKTINNWRTQPRPPYADSVNAVARALDIDQMEALRLAGVIPSETETAGSGPAPMGRNDDEATTSEDEAV